MIMKEKKGVLLLLMAAFVLCFGCGVRQEPELTETPLELQSPSLIESKEKKSDRTIVLEHTLEDKKEETKDTEVRIQEEIESLIENMTLEEKAAQLIIILPEALIQGVDGVTVAADRTKKEINNIPVGGFIFLSRNLQSREQVKSMMDNIQLYSMERVGVPAFLCIDEEGGAVTRISGTGKFDVPSIEDMWVLGQTGNFDRASEVGLDMGQYLSDLGFNVDFAPVADVLTNEENGVVKHRSFGREPELVSNMAAALFTGLEEKGIYGTYKHFPGHGMTADDTHEGYAYSEKTWDQLEKCELIKNKKGIEEGVSFIMAGHISLPGVTGDHRPASLSEYMLNHLLREKMGYNGIIITDAMNMGAIVKEYSSKEAAVLSLQAGADVILMPDNFQEAYEGVIKAVEEGILSLERVNESLRRIFYVKQQIKIRMESSTESP